MMVGTASVDSSIDNELDRLIREAEQQIADAEDVKRRAEQIRNQHLAEQQVIQDLFGKLTRPTHKPTKPPAGRRGRGRPSKGSISIAEAVKAVLQDGPQPMGIIVNRVFAMGARSNSPNPGDIVDQSIRKMRKAGVVDYDTQSRLYSLSRKVRT